MKYIPITIGLVTSLVLGLLIFSKQIGHLETRVDAQEQVIKDLIHNVNILREPKP